ncbi:MAG: TIGR01459 family HAD-type hydrolase [Actinobacteria bacterium]|nr:TIGR01459 family HAD-type hydrolase [Actinomycetota bacterium]
MPLIDDYDGFLVDLDGVVWTGREPVPGSPEALAAMLAAGKEVVFVTNNPSKPAEAYAKRLQGYGVETTPDRIVTAGIVVAKLAAEAAGPGGGALVLGYEPLQELIAATGMRVVDVEEATEAKVVVVSGFVTFTYEHLRGAKFALDAGAALVATSHDATMPMPGGEWPGTGAILAAVEVASGRKAEIAGKPERHLFDLALSKIPDAKRVAMIGDRLSSDIAGGHAAGLDTILVLSGTSGSGGSEDPETAAVKPDLIVANLAALV